MINQAFIGVKQFGSNDLASSMVRPCAQQVRCNLATKTAPFLLTILPEHTAGKVTAAKLLETYDSLLEHHCVMWWAFVWYLQQS